MRRCLAAIAVLIAVPASLARGGTAAGSPPLADARLAQAWRLLRAVDCARCHGKDYDGLAAPSIVEYVRTQSRERFVRMVLEGEPARGMPGYLGNARVRAGVDDLYLYFAARAQALVDAGSRPAREP